MPQFNISTKVWTVISQWAHIFVGAVVAEYTINHTTNAVALAKCGGAALIPLIYRWANPADTFPLPSKALAAADSTVKATIAEAKSPNA